MLPVPGGASPSGTFLAGERSLVFFSLPWGWGEGGLSFCGLSLGSCLEYAETAHPG